MRICMCLNANVLLDSTMAGYPCLECIFVVNRDIRYYVIQYYVPSAMLVILSWISFWISVDAVVARVNIGLLTVLTLTTQVCHPHYTGVSPSLHRCVTLTTQVCHPQYTGILTLTIQMCHPYYIHLI